MKTTKGYPIMTITWTVRTIIAQGYKAYDDDLDVDANPYEKDDPRYDYWMTGYETARAKDEG